MMRIYIKSIVPVLTLFLVSCGKNKSDQAGIQETTVLVTVNTVQIQDSDAFMSTSGKVEAANRANLSTRIMGFVEKLHVKTGNKVRKGQLLLTINSNDLLARQAQAKAATAEANAAFSNAEKDYDRYRQLFAQSSASQKEMDDMTVRFEMAKARLETARQMQKEVEAQLSYTQILAPFSGVVTNTFVDKGEMASPGMPLVAMETPGNFEVVTTVSENYIHQVEEGNSALVEVRSLGTEIPGIITEVSSSALNTGSQYLVKIALSNTNAPLHSGMFATVKFPVRKVTDASSVLIPKEAIVRHGQLTGVYVVSEESKALLRWVRLGREHHDQVEVLSGLSKGETFVVTAKGKLYNGVRITTQSL
ncbi:efflux RND transporter periplasmic adaptor subunit [Ascidiimonas aurantiaca]|uniref:efflux RND transporter periplasmic adaptor subunit n=1 Tax=Ascidiimonas aurantiaca TaxID=1685432 RepID=UPI0030EDC226